MRDALASVPAPCRFDGVRVLCVSALQNDAAALRQILKHSNWQFFSARNCAEAETLLRTEPVAVVLCEPSLPDGRWTDLYRATRSLPYPPEFVLTAVEASDALWMELLQLGGYDVLTKPFEASPVFRAISMAWRQWRSRQDRTLHGVLPGAAVIS
jgi:DNA-binding response OmpR family regulator